MSEQYYGRGYLLPLPHYSVDSNPSLPIYHPHPHEGITCEAEAHVLPTPPEKDVCVVCGAFARGLHFGVIACAACGAFFRRSVAEQRNYFCSEKRNCTIIHGLSNRKLCRFCRFRKCVASGMLAHKVQSKMRPSEPDIGTVPLTIADNEEISCSIDECARMYLILEEKRMTHYLPDRSMQEKMTITEPANMGNHIAIVESEPEFVTNFLRSSGSFNGLTVSDQMAVFKNYLIASRLTEQARVTALRGGTELNRFHLLDGSFIPATESGLTNFYGSGKSPNNSAILMDPGFLARMSLPSAEFHLQYLVKPLQKFNLSDQEFAALLSLLLWDTANPDLSLQGKQAVQRKRQRIINELCEHYKSTKMDIPIRFANLILLLTPIEENTRMWKEMLLMIELMKTKKSTDQELLTESQFCKSW